MCISDQTLISLSAFLTYRMLKRATMVMEIISKEKVLDNMFLLRKVRNFPAEKCW